MKNTSRSIQIAALIVGAALAPLAQAQPAPKPYSITQTAQYPGTGGIDYVTSDADGRKLYVPRGNEVLVFDLDSLKPAGKIAGARAHGVAVDPQSHRGFCSSNPIVMWDTQTLATLRTIPVQGRPDGISFEPVTHQIYVFSHSAPNVTVLDGSDGHIAGTIDLGGAPEQAASDGQGRMYVDIEDKDAVAVIDVKSLQVTQRFPLGGKGGTPAGLALDAKSGRLFVFCRNPQVCVVLDAASGAAIATVPTGRGTDGGAFNPHTGEAFSSQGDGTLTIIKENSPQEFVLEQTLATKPRAKTCSLDLATDRLLLIALEPLPGTAPAPAPAAPLPSDGAVVASRRYKGGFSGPGLLDLIVVGR